MAPDRSLEDVWAAAEPSKLDRHTGPRRLTVIATPGPRAAESWILPGAIIILGLVIVHAMAEPQLIGCRFGGREAAAIGALRTLNTAQSIYRESGKRIVKGRRQYADSLAELSATGTDLVDDVLGTGSKQGYRFRIAADPDGTHWDAEAHALTGRSERRFYTNDSGVIYFSRDDPTRPVPLTGGRGGPPLGYKALGG